jgi:hypothetical protein
MLLVIASGKKAFASKLESNLEENSTWTRIMDGVYIVKKDMLA